MRVLWFTNALMPAVYRHFGRTVTGGGHWMSVLLEALKNESDIQLAVATAHPGLKDTHFCDKGIDYFVVGQPNRLSYLSFRQKDFNRCQEIIKTWTPDIIHVHGTERFYGLLTKEKNIDVPLIIALQGLLSEYVHEFWGNLSLGERLRMQTVRALLRGRGWLLDYVRYRKAAMRELEIIMSGKNFIGRTDWDKAHTKALNPKAGYFQVGELLRPEFSSQPWSIRKIKQYSIIFTNFGSPLKNVETIFKAVAILKRDFPLINLRLVGTVHNFDGYHKLVAKKIQNMGLIGNIEFLGYLNAGEMSEALSGSHVFCIASLVENSPNSLCEAQLMGMPCVAGYAGGIPSLVEEGKTGLLFPPGDAAVLACRIREIFESDNLAMDLGAAARKEAIRRHDPETVVKQLLSAYEATVT